MGEKSEAKWAAEAFDFLRLYSGVGRSMAGLLLLEIGWAAYLVLVGHFVGGDAGAKVVSLQRPKIDLQLTAIYAYGSIGISLLWAIFSGVHQYATLPLWRGVQNLLLLLAFLAAIAILLLNCIT